MDKKEYITNQFKRTFGKKYENYCITRIYALLNRLDVQIVTQQLFRRDNGIALADLYFPQLKTIIEVDESYHLRDEWHKKEDLKRTEEIIKHKLNSLDEVVSHKVKIKRIDATQDIETINNRIDEIVKELNDEIKSLGDNFAVWELEYKKPEFYIQKGFIELKDNAGFRTVQEVSELFNKGYKKSQKAYFKVNDDWSESVSCCKLKIDEDDECKNIKFLNEITSDGMYIYESEKGDNAENFAVAGFNEKNQKRYMFAKYRDYSGSIMYKFRGVFILDIDKTEKSIEKKEYKRVWKKISDKIDISKYFK